MNTRAAIALLACCVFASFDAGAQTSVGLHLVSQHFPERDHHNQDNFGLYVQHKRWLIGGYRNSLNRDTYYAAYAQPLGYGFDLVAGVGSGYRRKCETHSVTTYSQVTHKGETFTVKSTERVESCRGFSKGSLAPVAGLTYTAPAFFGASPRIWVVPGIKGASSTVIHLSASWAL